MVIYKGFVICNCNAYYLFFNPYIENGLYSGIVLAVLVNFYALQAAVINVEPVWQYSQTVLDIALDWRGLE